MWMIFSCIFAGNLERTRNKRVFKIGFIIIIMKKSLMIAVVALIIIGVVAWYVMQQPAEVPKEQGSAEGIGAAIVITEYKFTPATVNIRINETVTWRNEGNVTHDVTIDNGLFDVDLEAGETFSYIFNETGIYDYHCDIHPSMKGRVVVS